MSPTRTTARSTTRTTAPTLTVAVLAGATLAGCTPADQGVEPAEFASVACTTWLDQDEFDTFQASETIRNLTGTAQEQQEQIVTMAEGVVAHWEWQRDTIAEAAPAVKDGEEIVALFTDYYDTRIEGSLPAIEEFAALPPGNTDTDIVMLQEAGLLLATEMWDTESKAEYPFMAIDNQAVVNAILDDETCGTFLEERGW